MRRTMGRIWMGRSHLGEADGLTSDIYRALRLGGLRDTMRPVGSRSEVTSSGSVGRTHSVEDMSAWNESKDENETVRCGIRLKRTLMGTRKLRAQLGQK